MTFPRIVLSMGLSCTRQSNSEARKLKEKLENRLLTKLPPVLMDEESLGAGTSMLQFKNRRACSDARSGSFADTCRQ